MDDTKKNRRSPEKRYTVQALVLGAVLLAGGIYSALRPGAWAFAVIPLLGACGTGLVWCLAARLWFCRDKERLLAKSFTRPLRLAMAVPVWLGLTMALYMLPGVLTALDSGLAESVVMLVLLAGVFLVPPAALGMGAASVWAAVRHMRRTPETGSRAYREGPFALAMLLCVAVVFTCVFLFIYLLA